MTATPTLGAVALTAAAARRFASLSDLTRRTPAPGGRTINIAHSKAPRAPEGARDE